jgi:hypothetical protein
LGISSDLKRQITYTFQASTQREFLLIVGNKAFVESQEKRYSTPTDYALRQNYPNPFNPATQIRYDVPKPSRVRIDVFNVLGQKIRTLVDEQKPAGSHTVLWDGRMDNGDLAASGVYTYRMTTGDFTQSKKLLLMR